MSYRPLTHESGRDDEMREVRVVEGESTPRSSMVGRRHVFERQDSNLALGIGMGRRKSWDGKGKLGRFEEEWIDGLELDSTMSGATNRQGMSDVVAGLERAATASRL